MTSAPGPHQAAADPAPAPAPSGASDADGVPPEGRRAFGGARVERIARVDVPLRARLLRIWTDVSNAGGWVGFVPPVAEADVAPVLDAALARVH
ncbi:hypothetical protein ACVU7I_17985, partial [Patulibacter sp. S7RM1-6]